MIASGYRGLRVQKVGPGEGLPSAPERGVEGTAELGRRGLAQVQESPPGPL